MTRIRKAASLPPEDRDLVARAISARRNAYAPYSHFAVGAAVRTTKGDVYVGANMENASYGVAICAEVAALSAANSSGDLMIEAIAVVAASLQAPPADATSMHAMPCGRCRQLIFEAAQLSGVDVKVISADEDGRSVAVTTIGALLPDAFGPKVLATREVPTKSEAAADR